MRRLLAPARLRRLIRQNEIALTALAACIGLVAGGAVMGLQAVIHLMGHWIFGASGYLSASETLEPLRAFGGPVIGGALMALSYYFGPRWFGRIADPIEANAIAGGKMNLAGSLFLSGQTVVSSGFGASVGMEAAYTQVTSALASLSGQRLRLRREDMRLLVAAAAGAAIAAAFNAPLAGAFYAFELVLAGYSAAAVLPVLAATLSATAIARLLGGNTGGWLFYAGDVPAKAYPALIVIALTAAALGILLMCSVSWAERAMRKTRLPGWSHPLLGGVLVGLLALESPQVLSSGHGAMDVVLAIPFPVETLLWLLGLKMLASVISLGSGFRGGLFFASLLLGALLGKSVGALWITTFDMQLPVIIFAIVGMCAWATAVIGAPMAMSFLALELTQSLPLALSVLFSALVASAIVRQFFGFSFSTWRFHLRGEAIRSAADVGWLRDLTVGRLMRRSIVCLPATMTVGEARRRFALGSTKAVPLVDDTKTYRGLCALTDLHAEALDPKTPLADIAIHTNAWLLPAQNVQDAIRVLSRHEADMLAVLGPDRDVLGIVNEQYCLKRYAEEMNKRLYPVRR
ncbi:chloride channel protein [Salipiger sp. PrR002]|uniref:chloride channel protein n=1 Tax=Salipiger sp. PrR002 TaxID=2706489 RepID=UPI0013B940E6|nr:chloride channel protein [Salipiger sp. PrR002]NDW01904.1 chloride channel protein [Salipiger sp. PrR002]NDW59066.1 chloride channel protein [Salipiger sp. PrR004]